MVRNFTAKAALSILTATGLAAVSGPAAAGRCGGAYPVDAPTTLSEVARQCNVSLAALKEANTGVDPANVRPGQHLAIPDEVIQSAAGPQPVLQTGSSSSAARIANAGAGPVRQRPLYEPVYEPGRADAFGPVNARSNNAGERNYDRRSPSWLDPATAQGGHYSISNRLSYQKLSALRIRNAGLQRASAGSPRAAQGDAVKVNCSPAIITDANTGDNIRKIITARDGTVLEVKMGPAHRDPVCTVLKPADEFSTGLIKATPGARLKPSRSHGGYRLPDYNKIGVMPRLKATTDKVEYTISGDVIDEEDGCLILAADDKQIWRLAAGPGNGGMIGQRVTIWGMMNDGSECGAGPSIDVSHAIYAEPWTGR